MSGTVTLDGKPLSGAAVILFPQEHGAETVVGMTDQNGRFIITPAAGRSIAYGTYKVVVSKREQLTPAQLNAFITPKELLPAKYSDLSQTVLSVNVTSAADIDLHLTR
ncbi:MAG TPA: carboxypeptidase-like regulatory domain-containing protein [Gemmataceae bacterium]|nr:carboxypeptidase-like regulatory domain-containing protein [Gemmataceae bacterium]